MMESMFYGEDSTHWPITIKLQSMMYDYSAAE